MVAAATVGGVLQSRGGLGRYQQVVVRCGMAYDQQARNACEHKASLPPLALARAEHGGKHLVIYARKLALQPRLRPL